MDYFKYVGSVVKKGHEIEKEIKQRIAARNIVFYANKKMILMFMGPCIVIIF